IVQVSQAISEMDKVTQQNASLVEEASAAAASLEEQGARLTEAVGAFRLNGAHAGRTPAAANAAKPAPLTPAAVVSGDNWETF
ncbi:methyl-accepting chemotaxis protein, partial [Enterobacter cloacae subsp. cloacae]